MVILYVLGAIALLNLIFWWYRQNHELEIKRVTKIGTIEARVGIETPSHRDFDLTISCDPLWCLTFQLSLWSVYCGFSWSRDWPDCEGTEQHCDCECTIGCAQKDEST